jgi:hypothetical protein
MDYTAPAKSQPVKCPQCGADVAQKPGPGRIKQFCTPWHGKLFRQAMGFDRL